jgi:hypothetical protein
VLQYDAEFAKAWPTSSFKAVVTGSGEGRLYEDLWIAAAFSDEVTTNSTDEGPNRVSFEHYIVAMVTQDL